MVKKNLSIILVILFTLLLIAMVIWVFNKRIAAIEMKTNSTTSYVNAKSFESLFKNHSYTFFKTINLSL